MPVAAGNPNPTPGGTVAQPDITIIPANAGALAFRPNIDSRLGIASADFRLITDYFERNSKASGYGAVSGGNVTAGAGLAVNVGALEAVVGVPLQTTLVTSVAVSNGVGATRNRVYIRESEEFTVQQDATLPDPADGKGEFLLWAEVEAAGGVVIAIDQTMRTQYGYKLIGAITRESIPVGDTVLVASDFQAVYIDHLKVDGILKVDGKVRVTS